MCIGVAHAERRIALVIGNAAYQNTPALSNPVNDGEDLAAVLKRVGFAVVLERNLNKRGMEGAIARFARMSQDADTALFFYAGHGMQWRGINYLVPVDARMEDEFNLNFELTRLDDVLFGLERARGVKILVLDACRNNPLLDRLNRTSSTRDLMATRGFAKIETTRGMVIAYSTQINQVAVDGTGRNSPFTQALVKEIDVPGLEIGTMFRRVAAHVNKITEGRQLPELSVSLLGEFYLNSRETDLQTWAKIRTSSDPSQLKDFITRYPSSDLLAHAQQRLDAMERAERTRIERERAERERLAREQAERERLAKDQAERDKVQREQSEREKLDKEKQEKERIAREQTERLARERTEREKADQEKRAREQESNPDQQKSQGNTQTAMLTPPADTKPQQPPSQPKIAAGGPGQPKLFFTEPPMGVHALRLGEKAYVDDKSCPEGQIKEIIGGALKRGIDRRRRCVSRNSISMASRTPDSATRSLQKDPASGVIIPRKTDKEPGAGAVRHGTTMLIDDGSCPKGMIKEITGGNQKYDIPRTRRCIKRN
ncbi:MAG: caspase family protein [Pseudorhodoplanes sp.]|nr:caspase family protein [Pseudorhodoplanes sp.]